MLHYEQVFGNVSERKRIKCCRVLMKHCHKVKGEQVITLQMAEQLKTKNINVVPGQIFCCQCLAQVAQGNARKIKNSITFRTNPNTYLGT